MKRNLMNTLLYSIFMLSPFVATAQPTSYQTPEYSGPTARFDRELETYRAQENALQASRERLEEAQRMHRNDLAVEKKSATKTKRIKAEMIQKREDSLRANRRIMSNFNE